MGSEMCIRDRTLARCSEDWPALARFCFFHSSKDRKLALSSGESASGSGPFRTSTAFSVSAEGFTAGTSLLSVLWSGSTHPLGAVVVSLLLESSPGREVPLAVRREGAS